MGEVAEINLSDVAQRVISENSLYEILTAFVNQETGLTNTFHKAAVAEKVTYSKPIVASVINGLYCTGYLDEVAQVGKSKIYALSELGYALIRKIIEIRKNSN